jgi:hypothetical protein
MQTDRTSHYNKLRIITRDNIKGTGRLTGTVTSGDRNVIQKEAEKTLKYTDLTQKYSASVM